MEIIAEKREKFGKKTKAIKRDRKLPAVVFGKGIDSIAIKVDLNDFVKVYKKAGETTLVDVKFNGNSEKVLIRDIQLDPVSDTPIHVSFYKVNLTEKITAEIPVHVIGEEESAIIKNGEGMVLTLLNTIEVEALPADLPSAFEIDISTFTEVGQGVTVAELNYDKSKVEITGVDEEELVVKIDYAEMAEEEEEELTEEEMLSKIEATEETAEEETDEGEETETNEE